MLCFESLPRMRRKASRTARCYRHTLVMHEGFMQESGDGDGDGDEDSGKDDDGALPQRLQMSLPTRRPDVATCLVDDAIRFWVVTSP